MNKLIIYILIGFFSSTSLSILNKFQVKYEGEQVKIRPLIIFFLILSIIVNILSVLLLKIKTITKLRLCLCIICFLLLLQLFFLYDTSNDWYFYSILLLTSFISIIKEVGNLIIIEKYKYLIGYLIGKIGFSIVFSYFSYKINSLFIIYLSILLKNLLSFILILILKKIYEYDYIHDEILSNKNDFLVIKNNNQVTFQSKNLFFNREDYFFTEDLIIKSKSIPSFLYKNLVLIMKNHVFNLVFILFLKGGYVFFIINDNNDEFSLYNQHSIYNSNSIFFEKTLFSSIWMMIGVVFSLLLDYFTQEIKYKRLILYVLLVLSFFLVVVLYFDIDLYVDVRIIRIFYRILFSSSFSLNLYEVLGNKYVINKAKEVSLILYIIFSSVPYLLGFYFSEISFFISFDKEV